MPLAELGQPKPPQTPNRPPFIGLLGYAAIGLLVGIAAQELRWRSSDLAPPNQMAQAEIGNETIVKLAPTGIAPAEISGGEPSFGALPRRAPVPHSRSRYRTPPDWARVPSRRAHRLRR